jgi:phage-related protein
VVEAEVGQKLLPVLSDLLGWLLKMAQSKQVGVWITAISKGFDQVRSAVVPLAPQIVSVFNTIRKALSVVMPLIKSVVVTDFRLIGDAVRLVLDVLTGRWGKAWGEVKNIAGDALHGVVDIMGNVLGLVGRAAGAIGNAIWHGILGALQGIGNALLGVIKGAINYGIIGPFDSAIGVANAAIKKANDANIFSGATGNIPSVPTIQRLARGGIVGGRDTGGRDSVLAMLAPGELVLNRQQQGRLASMLGVGTQAAGSTVTQHLHFHSHNHPVPSAMASARFAAQAAFTG